MAAIMRDGMNGPSVQKPTFPCAEGCSKALSGMQKPSIFTARNPQIAKPYLHCATVRVDIAKNRMPLQTPKPGQNPFCKAQTSSTLKTSEDSNLESVKSVIPKA